MPSFSVPIVVDGQVIGIACGRRQHVSCSTPGCRNDAPLLCDFPVTRKGKPGTCDRRICRGCAVSVGPDKDHCAAHARASKPGATK